jgi:predicted permease
VYFFVTISATTLADIRSGWIFPIASVFLICVSLSVSAPLFRLLRFPEEDRRAGMALSTFGNSGYIPLALMEIFPLTLPVLAAKFSPATATVYIGAFLLVNSPIQWSLGNWLIAGSGGRPKMTQLITPPFVGILAGLAVVVTGAQGLLFDQHLPFLYAYKALEKVGSLTLPLIMICLGAMIAELSFETGSQRGMLGMAAAVASVRFLVLPLCFVILYVLLLRPLGFTPVQNWVLFLEMHVPPATNLTIMAVRAERNEHHVSFTLLVTYLLYIVVLPLFMYIFIRLTGT